MFNLTALIKNIIYIETFTNTSRRITIIKSTCLLFLILSVGQIIQLHEVTGLPQYQLQVNSILTGLVNPT